MGKLLRLIILAPCVLTCAGCRDSKPAGDPISATAKAKISEIAASPAQNIEVPGIAPVDGIHPIDQVPQGKRFRQASAAVDRGDFNEAERIGSELAADSQYNVLSSAVQGLILAKKGNLDEALRIAEKISTVPVMQSEAYVIAGEVFQRQNRLNEALDAFQNALKLNPRHVRANLWLGAIYYDTGAMRLATNHLRKAAELDPVDVNSLLLSAKIFKEYEQFDEAIRDYRELLTRSLKNDVQLLVRINLAECLIAIRDLGEARITIQNCMESPKVLATRSAIEELAGDNSAALELAQSVLNQSPSDRAAGLVAGRILLVQRDWNVALPLLERLTKSLPYDHEPRLLYGRALVGSGDKVRGESEIGKATELKDTFLKFADLHQEAIKRPKDAVLRVEIGRLAEQLGKLGLAQNWYRAAVGLDDQNAEAAAALKRMNSVP